MSDIIKQENYLAQQITDNEDLIRQTIVPDLDTNEFRLFIEVCKNTGLNPIMRQVYAIKRSTSKKIGDRWVKEPQVTYQTSIDGFRLIADRTGKYGGSAEPTFGASSNGHPEWAKVIVKKLVGEHIFDVGAVAYWDEYKQEFNGKLSNMWSKMPRTMLAKCAEALALRKAFPAQLSGIYTNDEMAQADTTAKKSIKKVEVEKEAEIISDDIPFEQPEIDIGKLKQEMREMLAIMKLPKQDVMDYKEMIDRNKILEAHSLLTDRYDNWKENAKNK